MTGLLQRQYKFYTTRKQSLTFVLRKKEINILRLGRLIHNKVIGKMK